MSPRAGLDQSTILAAAALIADEQGLEAVTLALLAKKLNVRSPSLYNHIGGLQHLRAQLAVMGLRKLYDELRRTDVDEAGMPLDDAVHTYCNVYVAFVRKHPGLYAAGVKAAAPDETELAEAGRKIVALTVRLLHPYGLDGDAALHAVRGLRSMLHGFATLEQAGGFGMSLNLDESLRSMVQLFLAGIRASMSRSIHNEQQ
ncbi:TetR/AcrR family transcriptional regulator [Paenibacillaceae bacterium]|nr:TetR/AcrR family transcriptional regulator [Paenibacillaceae bacterium]